ncbi:nuclear transport factor 2 family protein [Nocardia sp. NPDC056100]|uniref:nuclear transport factor 2 family protein n=1 Tax=Nocardia sp. NPDC056100 TaxID=3345712 RepID=UPI0035DD103E
MNTADKVEILGLVADLGLGLDLADRERYRRCFGDTVLIHNPAFQGADAWHSYSGDEWADRVTATQARLTSIHTLTCVSTEVYDGTAETMLMQQALFADAEGSYQVAGPLRLTLVDDAGWRIERLRFEVIWTTGDPEVYARARKAVL